MKDDLTRPERAAQVRQAKRYRAAINREGRCCACKHRDKTFGVWHCQNSPGRQYPQCETDNGVGRFTFDDSVLARFQDGGKDG